MDHDDQFRQLNPPGNLGDIGSTRMTDGTNNVELQEKLARLARRSGQGIQDELALVRATGAMPPAWTIKILSLDSYNLYNVQLVNITTPGDTPSVVSGDLQAYNVAEPFTEDGSISSGMYAVMWRVGKNNVFYVKP